MKESRSILLVEDDFLDQKSVRRAFKDLNISNPIIIKDNGKEALEYLKTCENELPSIILLDLNMPQMGGLEFLDHLKAIDHLKNIPSVVLSTSEEEKDVREAYKLGGCGYFIKPIDYLQFVKVIKIIRNYWSLSIIP